VFQNQLLPSTSVINTSPEAGKGIDYEAGCSYLINHRLFIDTTVFTLGLVKFTATSGAKQRCGLFY